MASGRVAGAPQNLVMQGNAQFCAGGFCARQPPARAAGAPARVGGKLFPSDGPEMVWWALARRVEQMRNAEDGRRTGSRWDRAGATAGAVVRRAGALAREANLDDEDVRYIFWHLIGLSRRMQMEARS